MPKTLTYDQAREFYDKFGAKQDHQSWYEDAAVRILCKHSAFNDARSIYEFGCGTGKLACQLLEANVGAQFRYVGVDVSETMVGLARQRVQRFGSRADIQQSSGDVLLDQADGSVDRFVGCYVLDLLSPEDSETVLNEAHRILVSGGLLCTTSLTPGDTFVSRLVSGAWSRVHAMSPKIVGGCRPINLGLYLPSHRWAIQYQQIVRPFGVPSEVLVVRRL